MNKEHDRFLCEKYPLIFTNRHSRPQETSMVWGFECGDGWFDLINKTCHLIQRHIEWRNKYGTDTVPQVVASQVKEKFGTLRFYYDGGDEYIAGIVALAEEMSGTICEVCGNSAEIRPTRWIKTLCDKHYEENQK